MQRSLTRIRVGSVAAFAAVLICCAASAIAGQQQHTEKGRLLAEALRTLQRRGLPIVFSSEVVTPEMRVVAEPRAPTARQQLDELLVPHGLEAVEGRGQVIAIVRARPDDMTSPPSRRTERIVTTLRGQVIDAARRVPLSGALVRSVGGSTSAITDERGRFRLDVTGLAAPAVSVSLAGYAPARLSVDGHREGALTTIALEPSRRTYAERVTVMAPRAPLQEPGVASEMSLDAGELRWWSGALADDPLHAVRTLPRVAAIDDFRAEFSIRGSPYRHVGVVIDGVDSSWLRHSLYRRGEVGSLSMFGTDSLQSATLQAGAYPQRYGDWVGAQLELTMRQGSREGTRFHGSLGGTSAALVGEGPLGRQKRGSWIVGLRNSFVDWPVRRQEGLAFAFADAQAKLVYDVTPRQQLSVTALGGRSMLDGPDDDPVPDTLATGTNQAALMTVGWRSTVGARTALRQRVSVVAQEFSARRHPGQDAGAARNQALSYAGDMLQPMLGGSLEAGGQLARMRGARRVETPLTSDLSQYPQQRSEAFGATWLTRSAHAHFTRTVGRRVAFGAGLRLADSTLVRHQSLARWVLTKWSIRPGWDVTASAGVSFQYPEVEQVHGTAGTFDLRPERATHVDIGLTRQLSNALRWQVTFYNRAERDVLREPDLHPRVVGGVELAAPIRRRYQNALRGSSRGVELLAVRGGDSRLTGWIAYVYGRTRHTDIVSHEIFWGDFDRRHGVNAAAMYRLSEQTSLGLVFRGATNVPIPGYFTLSPDGLFAGERRNEVRLPNYARLDARAQRIFTFAGRRIALLADVSNVLNRQNQAPADGLVLRTGKAVGFTQPLLSRRLSFGFAVEF